MDRYNEVKLQLKGWEQEFVSQHRRKPNKVSYRLAQLTCFLELFYSILFSVVVYTTNGCIFADFVPVSSASFYGGPEGSTHCARTQICYIFKNITTVGHCNSQHNRNVYGDTVPLIY